MEEESSHLKTVRQSEQTSHAPLLLQPTTSYLLKVHTDSEYWCPKDQAHSMWTAQAVFKQQQALHSYSTLPLILSLKEP